MLRLAREYHRQCDLASVRRVSDDSNQVAPVMIEGDIIKLLGVFTVQQIPSSPGRNPQKISSSSVYHAKK